MKIYSQNLFFKFTSPWQFVQLPLAQLPTLLDGTSLNTAFHHTNEVLGTFDSIGL